MPTPVWRTYLPLAGEPGSPLLGCAAAVLGLGLLVRAPDGDRTGRTGLLAPALSLTRMRSAARPSKAEVPSADRHHARTSVFDQRLTVPPDTMCALPPPIDGRSSGVN